MKSKTIIIYKNEGETPLEALDRLRVEQPEYKDAVLSYAGRLDPMAEGKLLVLVGEENKEREKYLALDKEYEVEILFGVGTDTGDILGITTPAGPDHSKSALDGRTEGVGNVQDVIQSFVGKFTQKYPHYSSKTVQGKPLFQWAREGRLDEIKIPEREAEIYSIGLLKTYEMSGEEILKKVSERIGKVKGDFRQKEILNSWKESLVGKECMMGTIIQIRVSCSSGTYMRSLAEAIGQKAGNRAIAWSIKRLLLKSPHTQGTILG